MIKLNAADSPDGEESLGVCESFAIDFNNNSIQVNAAKSLPCLAYKKNMFIALHSPLGKQFAHLSEQIWRQSLWTVTSGRWGILASLGSSARSSHGH